MFFVQVLDRAVALSATDKSNYDYDRFLRSLGFDLLNDDRQYFSGMRDIRRVISSTSEGVISMPPSTPELDVAHPSLTNASPRRRNNPTFFFSIHSTISFSS